MRRATRFALLAAAIVLAPLAALAADAGSEPLIVNYGASASARQGDNDHKQVIYLSIPDTTTGPLYLRLFDPDTAGKYDEVEGSANSGNRYAVFGGPGAFVPDAAMPEILSETEQTAGELLAEKLYTRDRKVDGLWDTLAELDPAKGDHVGDRIVFRLLSEGTRGDDGNAFDVTLSQKGDDNVAPEGLKIFAYTTTVRMPRRGVITELRFMVPADAGSINVGNFDAAFGEAFLTTKFVSYPLEASGQNDWAVTNVPIRANDRGKEAAVTLSGGQEYPNDATFYVTDSAGKLIPFDLPPRLFTLNGRPSAFAVSNTLGTCTTVKLSGAVSSDPDGDPLTYVWHFGDGESEKAITTTHEYKVEGHFTAILEVNDNAPQLGNGSAANVPVFVKNPPEAKSDKRTLVAAGEANRYSGAPSTGRQWGIARHTWDFGDGTTLEGGEVDHAYAKPGVYKVTHTVVDDSGHPCNTAFEEFTVTVNAAPVAAAGPDQHVSVGQETVFDAGASTDSDGRIVSYLWDFGDGASASGQVVRHAYAAPATYTARLTIRDDSDVANSSNDDTVAIVVNDPPVAAAGADRSVAIGEPIIFDANASKDADGILIAYDWDFGDGVTGGGATANHAYAKSGTYTVTLTVTDDSTTDTNQRGDTLSVRVNQPPVAAAGPDQLVTASEVAFDGSASTDSDDSVALYAWDFGDGNTGTGARPAHVYARPGTYDVHLTVTDASKTIRSSAGDGMQVVVNARPIADAGPDAIAAPGEQLVFQGTRSLDPDGSIADYAWDFRDGASAAGQTVRHAFDKPGTFSVRLKVTDNTRQDEAVDYAETEVFINRQPVAVAGSDIAAVAGDTVKLSAGDSFDSDGAIVDYRWDFSDSPEPLTGAEVTRTFDKPGVYSVQLTVTDDSGASNGLATDAAIVAINHAPVADAGPNLVTDRTIITFDGTRSVDADGNALAYAWDFGDGRKADGAIVTHTYAEGGTYPVVLSVSDGTGLANAGATAAIEVKINRPPVAVAGENQRVCTGDIIVLDGSRSSDPEGGGLRYAWKFGDGTTSEIVNPTKSYTRGGVYPVTLTVEDDSGLANGGHSSEIAIRVDQGPVASAGPDILACAKTEVPFDGSASTDIDGVVNSFTWDFGDGNLGGGSTPSHIFDKPGNYRVFLTIQGEKAGICDAASHDELEIRIIEGPVAVIEAPDAIPVTGEATFDGSGSYMTDGRITAYEWDFGDGTTGTGATAAHKYAKAGVYAASLTLRSDSTSPTCKAVSSRHLITVNDPPAADAGSDKHVAAGEEALFSGTASKDPDGGIVAYDWAFGDGATATGIEARHRYRAPGAYTATLTIHDEANLANSVATDTVAVTVNPEPAPAIAGAGVACVGEKETWTADAGATGDASVFAWNFGDGATGESPSATHAYDSTGSYSLVLMTDDNRGRANSRQQATRIVHINAPPYAEAGADRMVCPGDTVDLTGAASTDADGKVTAYDWDFGDGATGEGEAIAHVYATPGTYRVTLTATDDAGASCSSTIDTLDVVVNAPPVANPGADRDVWIGGANDAILLDGSASSDPDGQALSHTWRIGDEGSEIGERIRHTLATASEIPVTLTVSDTSGLACGTASSTVRITARQRE